jgi:hypothetical protein
MQRTDRGCGMRYSDCRLCITLLSILRFLSCVGMLLRPKAAQYKGAGTINGDLAPVGEPYKFMLWARDGDPVYGDTFRIMIWYESTEDTETVVYDNGFDQPIGGGNIPIHAK